MASFNSSGVLIVTAGCDSNPSLFAGCQAGSARIWDVQMGERLRAPAGQPAAALAAAFSPDGNRIVTAGCSENAGSSCSLGIGIVNVWDGDGRFLYGLKGQEGWFQSASFSRDGRRIVAAGCDQWDTDERCTSGTLWIWSADTGTLVNALDVQPTIESAALNPDGTLIVTASCDRLLLPDNSCVASSVQIWQVSDGSKRQLIASQADWIRAANFSPDGTHIIVVGDNGLAQVLDRDGNLVKDLKDLDDDVTFANFSADGSRIITGGPFSARVYDDNGSLLFALQNPDNWLAGFLSADLSADGSRIAIYSLGGVSVWNGTGNLLQVLSDGSWSGSLRFDGRRLITANASNGDTRLWNVWGNIDDMLSEAPRRAGRSLTEEECRLYLHVSPCPQE
jgi:WD40 repeat protein